VANEMGLEQNLKLESFILTEFLAATALEDFF
jgi:hypothetical protein